MLLANPKKLEVGELPVVYYVIIYQKGGYAFLTADGESVMTGVYNVCQKDMKYNIFWRI